MSADPDWLGAAAYLSNQGLRLAVEPAPVRLTGGLANRNYQAMLEGAPVLFRCPPAGPLAAGASDMAREARLLTALAPHFDLAPRLHHACLDDSIIGLPFLLLEWRDGLAIGGRLPAGLDAGNASWLTDTLASAMAALHRLDPVTCGLDALGRSQGFASRTLAGWTRRADAAFASDRPAALDPLLARLDMTLPPDAPPRLLHMDPKFDNLLVDPATRRATALIDWDMATLGPPAFDLAVLLSYWIEPGDPADVHTLAAIPSLAPGWPPRAAAIAAYAAAAGAVPPDLPWYLALARLRLAVAWMQLYRLWERGSLAGDRYRDFPRLSAAILAHALDRFGET